MFISNKSARYIAPTLCAVITDASQIFLEIVRHVFAQRFDTDPVGSDLVETYTLDHTCGDVILLADLLIALDDEKLSSLIVEVMYDVLGDSKVTVVEVLHTSFVHHRTFFCD